MADQTIVCPACTRKLRVPEEQMGQMVQCPLCRVVFTAPPLPGAAPSQITAAAPPAKEPPARGEPVPERPREDRREQQPDAPREPAVTTEGDAVAAEPEPMLDVRRMLLLPGLGLLICGILGTIRILDVLQEVWRTGPEGMNKSLQNMPFSELFVQRPSPESLFAATLVVGAAFLLISIGMVVGGVQMLRLRNYWLAIAGSILGIVNIVSFCFSGPIGLWSLMVLRLPEVRAAFDATGTDEPPAPES